MTIALERRERPKFYDIPRDCLGVVIQSLPPEDVGSFAILTHEARSIVLEKIKDAFGSFKDWIERPFETEYNHNAGPHQTKLPFKAEELTVFNRYTAFLRLLALSQDPNHFWNALSILDGVFRSEVISKPSFVSLDSVAFCSTVCNLATDDEEETSEAASAPVSDKQDQAIARSAWPKEAKCKAESFFLQIASTFLNNYLAGIARGDLQMPKVDVFDPSAPFLFRGEKKCDDAKFIEQLQKSYSRESLFGFIEHAVVSDNGEALTSLLRNLQKAEKYTEADTLSVFKKYIPQAREMKKEEALQVLLDHRVKNETKKFFKTRVTLWGLSMFKALDKTFVNEVTIPVDPKSRFTLAALAGLGIEFWNFKDTKYSEKLGSPSCGSLVLELFRDRFTTSTSVNGTLSGRAKLVCMQSLPQFAGLFGLITSKWIDKEPSQVKRRVMYGSTLVPWIAFSYATGDYLTLPIAAFSLFQAKAIRSGAM